MASESVDIGVAVTGYICQNFPAHPSEEIEMVSAGEEGLVCPECGRMAGGPDDYIPFGDPPDYAPRRFGRLFGPADRATFREAVETWGLPDQIDMAVEEMGEAIAALQQYQRGRVEDHEVHDELADVRIMYEQLALFFDEDAVEQRARDKVERLRERLWEADEASAGPVSVKVSAGVLEELVETAHGDLERMVTADGFPPEHPAVEDLAEAVEEAEAALEEGQDGE